MYTNDLFLSKYALTLVLAIVNINPNPMPSRKNNIANSITFSTKAFKKFGSEYKIAPTIPTDLIGNCTISGFVIKPNI